MALTRIELEDAVREHIGAEASQDLHALDETLTPGVVYDIMTPLLSGDPEPYGHFVGAETYLQMWRDLYEVFASYDIDLLDVVGDEAGQRAWLQVHVTAVPKLDWHGVPAHQPVEWWAAAVCEFAPSGRMTRELVFGSLPPTLRALERIRDRASGGAG